MPLEDSRHGERVDSDLLLHRLDEEVVAYRMVRNSPPAEIDFRSHYELGVKPDPTKLFRAHDWFGVSLFVDQRRVDRLIEVTKGHGAGWNARVVLRPGEGLYYLFNERTSHLEVFGFPQTLLAMVDEIV